MNRSYSKIRHIQEANLVLENRRMEEKSKHFLMEDGGITQSNTPTIYIYLPYTLDPKNQSKKYNPIGRAKFTIIGQKTPGGGFNTDEYKKITAMSFDDVAAVGIATKATDTSNGNISGSFGMTQEMYDKLKVELGKPMRDAGSQKMFISFSGDNKYASFQIADYNATPTQK